MQGIDRRVFDIFARWGSYDWCPTLLRLVGRHLNARSCIAKPDYFCGYIVLMDGLAFVSLLCVSLYT